MIFKVNKIIYSFYIYDEISIHIYFIYFIYFIYIIFNIFIFYYFYNL